MDHLGKSDDHRLCLGMIQPFLDRGKSLGGWDFELLADRRQEIRVLRNHAGYLALRTRRDLFQPVLPEEPQTQYEDPQSIHDDPIGGNPQLPVLGQQPLADR